MSTNTTASDAKHNEREQKIKSYNVNLTDVITHFAILGSVIGFALGSAGHEFIEALVKHIVFPAISLLVKVQDLREWKVKGFGFGEVLLEFITLLFVIGFILLILHFLLKPIVQKIIGQEKLKADQQQENWDKLLRLNEEILQALERQQKQVSATATNIIPSNAF